MVLVQLCVDVHVCCENLSPPYMKNRRNENFSYVSKIPFASFLLFIGPESDHCLVLSVHHSVLLLSFAQIAGFRKVVRWLSLNCNMDLSNWYTVFSRSLHGFIKIDTWISLSSYKDLFKLLHGFVKVVLYISCPLPNKTKLKFDQDCKACWSFCFEQKVLNESKNSLPWVCCAFGNELFYPMIFSSTEVCWLLCLWQWIILFNNFLVHRGLLCLRQWIILSKFFLVHRGLVWYTGIACFNWKRWW